MPEAALKEIDLAGGTIRYCRPLLSTRNWTQKDIRSRSLIFTMRSCRCRTGIGLSWQIRRNLTPILPGYPGTTEVLGDFVIDLDPNWNPVWVWSSFDHLDINRHPYLFPDWTHSNALVYLPDGNLLMSMRHQSWVLKLDYEDGAGTGDILWRLGYQGDFTLTQDDPGKWFFAQHFPSLVASTGSQLTVAVFDNGDDRVLDGGGTCTSILRSEPLLQSRYDLRCRSRCQICELDLALRPGWAVFLLGWLHLQLENKDVEFDMTDPFNTASSRVMEIAPGSSQQIVWQLDITGGNAYRAYRIPSLYPGVSWQK